MNLSYFIFLFIFVNVNIFVYLSNLQNEKCKCSEGWMRKVSKYGVLIHTMLLVIVLSLVLLKKFKIFLYFNLLVKPILAPLFIIYFTILMTYFIKLYNSKCLCSENWKRKLLLLPISTLAILHLVGSLYIIFNHRKIINFVNK